MKLPRDLSGDELARALQRHGYHVTRQTGSHLRLTSEVRGRIHHISIPRHDTLKVGTLRGILGDVAAYLEVDLATLRAGLFKA
ncbi:MAG: type II toxin-antitoxin system HicA family toxin [Bacillati bacterium ANGP1]|uniref:Type II toxin-antitoxin system HicA family toxin n=1 Tax=Candidatus Segetimicrobium genomatis TaxID=2569760 RepID=A0A537KB15_9BACT|nr:MAG: type II toxin-antitoxin system HicA family toxin [Terrabacteria group bacterium ANGP1]HTD45787.1 type II toxin-antitoxin system HicA family toxin [bacterium]